MDHPALMPDIRGFSVLMRMSSGDAFATHKDWAKKIFL